MDGNAQYRSRYASLSSSYSHSDSYRQLSLGASGSVVVHEGGVTLAPQRGDTMVIVEAPAAEDARVTNVPGLKIDSRGYAVIPYVSPYRMNTITLDPEGMDAEVELDSTSQLVAPYAGAIAKLTFATRQGRALLITARMAGGQVLPFGAQVLDAQGQAVGLVAQASRIYVRASEPQGRLLVKWGDAAAQQCQVDYHVPEDAQQPAAGMTTLEATCR
ncbi:MAG: Outer membrane usher protein FimD [Paracidovorax wautersii]|uniref:Outer membrane usher protein FimD n=1 Tax=Paracidovorax wautersii TaxID=1177982 RepID=A0A7V8FRM6_9BURK|nr:MAG: Outer membrane usher protein FimD [Paracidovorax wautersii]